ncbi:MAG: hypothetical protein H7263_13825 [Candidatus Sericytochromatia bacterium]|nr:hypothetical protein [Candidatus Sericytochromatia bacterium]
MDCYCFVEWENTEEGKMPRLSDETPFLLIAGDPEISKWGLFECALPDDFEFDDFIELVSEELDILIYSATTYPAAIAQAREEMEISCRKMGVISREVFSEMFKDILRQYLQLQQHSPNFLAESLIDEEEYLSKGGFYWIVGFDAVNNEVRWVSDDYYIYENPVEDFGLDPQRLRNIFMQ